VQSTALSFGTATVAYPVANNEQCTAALIVDVNQVDLVRGRGDGARNAVTLGQYVNDRSYAASSFLSTAIGKVFGTAMSGRSKERPELAETPMPFTVFIAAMRCRGGDTIVRRIFEPLGYSVSATVLPLDPTIPTWGDSRYFDVTLTATLTIREVLEHLHVLIPVLDDAKHYWVGQDEIERLIRRGGDWLSVHPERELITSRALRHDKRLTREALARLASLDTGGADVDVDRADERADEAEQAMEEKISLNDQRMAAVVGEVSRSGARRVADLGCGEGKLIQRLLREAPSIEKVTGVDVSMRSLHRASAKLHLDTMAPTQRKRVELLQGALTYRDKRLRAYDTVTLVEVVEHVDPERLEALEGSVFEWIAPRTVIVTTPNIEYNVLFNAAAPDGLRHNDHRFEWTRAEFQDWANGVATRRGYDVRFEPIGTIDDIHGPPTQMAVFTKGTLAKSVTA
jgi:3' terminal RNA ribose 2'-O-methyltransferase Hen1